MLFRSIAIIDEISRAFDRLGAERGIFVALHSWGDTMPDLEVLQMLKEQNQQRLTTQLRGANITNINRTQEAQI